MAFEGGAIKIENLGTKDVVVQAKLTEAVGGVNLAPTIIAPGTSHLFYQHDIEEITIHHT